MNRRDRYRRHTDIVLDLFLYYSDSVLVSNKCLSNFIIQRMFDFEYEDFHYYVCILELELEPVHRCMYIYVMKQFN